MTAQTFLISGAPGFLGSHFVHTLLSLGHNVVGLKRVSSNLWRLENVLQNKNLRLYNSDDTDLYKAFSEQHIDAVIHTACSYGRNGESLASLAETNIVFGLKLFEMAEKFSVPIFFNTDTLLPEELNSYSLAKKQFVSWISRSAKNVRVRNMRIEQMYGTNDDDKKIVPWLISELKNNVPEIPLTKGEQTRDFIYVSDVVSAYLCVLEKSDGLPFFAQFDVCTGNQIPVKQFVSELVAQYKNLHPENQTFLDFGKIPYRDGEAMSVQYNIQPLLDLGWSAKIDYKKGIEGILF